MSKDKAHMRDFALPTPAELVYPQVYFKRTDKVPIDWPLPSRARDGDAGYDLKISHDLMLEKDQISIAATGIKIAIINRHNRVWEGQIRSRSGLASKSGIIVLNSPGTCDSGYRGELLLILKNVGTSRFQLREGDRVAQLVFNEVGIPAVFDCDAEKLPFPGDTERGKGGLGSSGVQ